MAPRSGITRREMLTGAASAAAAVSVGGLASCFPGVGGEWPDGGPDGAGAATCPVCPAPDAGATSSDDDQPSRVVGSSRVVTIQRNDSLDEKGKSLGQPQMDVVKSMIDAALAALTDGASNPWSVILPGVGRCSRIGLKVNCLNQFLPTSPAVVRAIIKSLLDNTDVCPGNILVWDRRLDELHDAGQYTDEHLQKAQLIGTVKSTTDPNGPGYSDKDFGTFQGGKPRLSRILLEQTDYTINLPVLKRHGQSGVTAALKNIYGIIDIPGEYHTDATKGRDLQTALPALYAIPAIRKSIKLTVVDALRAVINGDTASRSDSQPGRIFASLDPLALDYYALDLLNQLCAARKFTAVQPDLVKWMDNAYAAGLGAKNYELVDLSPGGPTLDGGARDASPDSADD